MSASTGTPNIDAHDRRATQSRSRLLIDLAGRLSMVVGSLLLCVFLLARIHGALGAGVALAQFETSTSVATPAAGSLLDPDTSLWSEGRIAKFRESLGMAFDPPIAVLRIPDQDLVVPVLPGTDEASLNRGLGWINGTALPGHDGNIGIAGHRDGFFRVLKDVKIGDRIELETSDGLTSWEITSTEVIDPEEVGVLGPTADPTLTLVTCYPFYFVGSAPQRFIVRASPVHELSKAHANGIGGSEDLHP